MQIPAETTPAAPPFSVDFSEFGWAASIVSAEHASHTSHTSHTAAALSPSTPPPPAAAANTTNTHTHSPHYKFGKQTEVVPGKLAYLQHIELVSGPVLGAIDPFCSEVQTSGDDSWLMVCSVFVFNPQTQHGRRYVVVALNTSTTPARAIPIDLPRITSIRQIESRAKVTKKLKLQSQQQKPRSRPRREQQANVLVLSHLRVRIVSHHLAFTTKSGRESAN